MKLVAVSQVMRDLLRQARRYAAVDATVFITGETGVGKDALARFIHASGPRKRDPFVTVDCPALPETLVEAELFGHERGAFTDATSRGPGASKLAGHGTLYLDAVTRLSPRRPGRPAARRRRTAGHQAWRDNRDGRPRAHHRVLGHGRRRCRPTTARSAPTSSTGSACCRCMLPPLRERPDDIVPLARSIPVGGQCEPLKRRAAASRRGRRGGAGAVSLARQRPRAAARARAHAARRNRRRNPGRRAADRHPRRTGGVSRARRRASVRRSKTSSAATSSSRWPTRAATRRGLPQSSASAGRRCGKSGSDSGCADRDRQRAAGRMPGAAVCVLPLRARVPAGGPVCAAVLGRRRPD